MLRYIWQQGLDDAMIVLKDEMGKPFWATPSRFLQHWGRVCKSATPEIQLEQAAFGEI
jgi:hypothetical protein